MAATEAGSPRGVRLGKGAERMQGSGYDAAPATVAVLVVEDVGAAVRDLCAIAGFARVDGPAEGPARLRLGDQGVIVARPDAMPPGFAARPFDHLALRVADADRALAEALAAGARPHAGFTPDGPREIADFWDSGVRFAFIAGPGGAPVEFCARLGAGEEAPGHEHYGLRADDAAAVAQALVAAGADEVARHSLPGPVEVRFLREDGQVWEIFDEAAPAGLPAAPLGWAGLAPWGAEAGRLDDGGAGA